MKKILDKIVSISLAVVSVVFVTLTVLFMFKPVFVTELDNVLVTYLLLGLTVIFVVLTILNIFNAFRNTEKISSVVLFKGKHSATKATISVVTKYVKSSAKNVKGVKVKKVVLFVDDNNDVTMKADIKIKKDVLVEDTITEVKAYISDTLKGVFNLEFKSINFTTVDVKNKYKPNIATIQENIEKEKEEIASIKAKENTPKQVEEEIVTTTEEMEIIPETTEKELDNVNDNSTETEI